MCLGEWTRSRAGMILVVSTGVGDRHSSRSAKLVEERAAAIALRRSGFSGCVLPVLCSRNSSE